MSLDGFTTIQVTSLPYIILFLMYLLYVYYYYNYRYTCVYHINKKRSLNRLIDMLFVQTNCCYFLDDKVFSDIPGFVVNYCRYFWVVFVVDCRRGKTWYPIVFNFYYFILQQFCFIFFFRWKLPNTDVKSIIGYAIRRRQGHDELWLIAS